MVEEEGEKLMHLIVARLCPQVSTTGRQWRRRRGENEADNNNFDELLFGRMIEPQI